MATTKPTVEIYRAEHAPPDHVQRFDSIAFQLTEMVKAGERFMQNPDSAQGGEALAEMESLRHDALAVLFDFDYHPDLEINRLTNAHSTFHWLRYEARRGNLSERMAFEKGRDAEQELNQLRRLRDEWKQIKEYSQSTEDE